MPAPPPSLAASGSGSSPADFAGLKYDSTPPPIIPERHRLGRHARRRVGQEQPRRQRAALGVADLADDQPQRERRAVQQRPPPFSLAPVRPRRAVQDNRRLGDELLGHPAAVEHPAAGPQRPAPAERLGDAVQAILAALGADDAAGVGPDQGGPAAAYPAAVVVDAVGLGVDDVDGGAAQVEVSDGPHGGAGASSLERTGRGRAAAVEPVGRPQRQ